MANIIKRVWNQNKMVLIEDLKGMAFQAEAEGHTFEISGIDDDGNPVTFSGTPSGVFLRPDNTDVALTCSISGGKIYATFPATCYSVPGRFGLTIYITTDGATTAVYAAIGTVALTTSGTIAPPATDDVVDLINDIATAVASIPASYSSLLADIAPTYSPSALYSVGQYAWCDGDLKRCIVPITVAETYTAAHWTSAVLGNDVADLKSALNVSTVSLGGENFNAPNTFSNTYTGGGYAYNAGVGYFKCELTANQDATSFEIWAHKTGDYSNRKRIELIKPVTSGTTYTFYFLLDSDHSTLRFGWSSSILFTAKMYQFESLYEAKNEINGDITSFKEQSKATYESIGGESWNTPTVLSNTYTGGGYSYGAGAGYYKCELKAGQDATSFSIYANKSGDLSVNKVLATISPVVNGQTYTLYFVLDDTYSVLRFGWSSSIVFTANLYPFKSLQETSAELKAEMDEAIGTASSEAKYIGGENWGTLIAVTNEDTSSGKAVAPGVGYYKCELKAGQDATSFSIYANKSGDLSVNKVLATISPVVNGQTYTLYFVLDDTYSVLRFGWSSSIVFTANLYPFKSVRDVENEVTYIDKMIQSEKTTITNATIKNTAVKTDLTETELSSTRHYELAVNPYEKYEVAGFKYADGFPLWMILDSNNNVIKYNSNFINAQPAIDSFITPEGSSKLIVNFQSQYTNYQYIKKASDLARKSDLEVMSKWLGKSIVWLGTSIPCGAPNNNYPNMVGTLLSCTVNNIAVGESSVACKRPDRIDETHNPYGFVTNWAKCVRCLTNTKVEMQWLIDHYDEKDENDAYIFTEKRPDHEPTEIEQAFYMSCSYEEKIIPLLNTSIDCWVFDHGHNDAANMTYYDGSGNQKTLDQMIQLYGINNLYTFETACNFLFNLIVNADNKARIVMIGEYDNRLNYVKAHQINVSESWEIPLYETWKHLGWNVNHTITTTGYWDNTTNLWVESGGEEHTLSIHDRFVRDHIHPHSDASGYANHWIASNIANWLNNISPRLQ